MLNLPTPAGRAILANRPVITSTSIDSTGLILTTAFNRAVTRVGTPTATADGSGITLAYKDQPTIDSLRWDITSGNPSGNPVLAGATVLLSAAAGVWTAGGIGNIAVSGQSVTNGSTVTIQGLFQAGPTWCFKDAAKTQPCGNGDLVYTWADMGKTGSDLSQSTAANRPTLVLSGSSWVVRFDGTTSQMVGPALSAWSALSHAVFVRISNASSTADYRTVVAVRNNYADGGWWINTLVSSVKWGTWQGTDKNASTTLSTAPTTYTLGLNGGDFRLNGAGDGTYASAAGCGAGGAGTSSSTTTNDNGLSVGHDTGAGASTGRRFANDIAGMYIGRAKLTGADLTNVETWLASLLP